MATFDKYHFSGTQLRLDDIWVVHKKSYCSSPPSRETGFSALVHTALQLPQIQRSWFLEPQPDPARCGGCSAGSVAACGQQNVETKRLPRLSLELFFHDRERLIFCKAISKPCPLTISLSGICKA